MKKLFVFLFSFCFVTTLSAQKVYFIYLQSDNSLPFYVKLNDKVSTSSSSGYLLLSNLVDSSYIVSIGFPPGLSKELKFNISIKGADKGYLLKNFDDGLALFDLQNLTVIKPIIDQTTSNVTYEAKNDSFTSLL